MALARSSRIPPRDPAPGLSTSDTALLETLRACARAAQRGPRLDLDIGCALLAPPAGTEVAVWGAALMRALDGAALRPMGFHPRGARQVAFGEAWTLRLVTALRNGDVASALFLAGRGVRRERRRQVLWLAGRLADALGAGNAAVERLESFQDGAPAFSQPAPLTECKEHA